MNRHHIKLWQFNKVVHVLMYVDITIAPGALCGAKSVIWSFGAKS